MWEWDFGDGETSSEQNPIHTYPAPGLYYACLTVSNEYSSDSSCQWITIESVSTEDAEKEERYTVHPNPFTDYVEITPRDGYHTMRITIVDVNGKVVAAPEITCPCRLKLGSIPAGVYFYTLEEVDFTGLVPPPKASATRGSRQKEGKMVGSGRLVKVNYE